MEAITCICLKYGTLYSPEYVNRLHAGLVRNSSLPVRLVCMTDNAQGLNPRVEVLPLPEETFAGRMSVN